MGGKYPSTTIFQGCAVGGVNARISDVLPWKVLSRHPQNRNDIVFIDVDFPDLILNKAAIVGNTTELMSGLTNLNLTGNLPCPLVSDEYVQVGCDLRDLSTLEKILCSLVNVANCSFLFVAEVSITYMDTHSADNIVEWASRIGDSQFRCYFWWIEILIRLSQLNSA